MLSDEFEADIQEEFNARASKEARRIADRVVPKYRLSGKHYSCTGTIANQWQAAYEGACMAYGVTP